MRRIADRRSASSRLNRNTCGLETRADWTHVWVPEDDEDEVEVEVAAAAVEVAAAEESAAEVTAAKPAPSSADAVALLAPDEAAGAEAADSGLQRWWSL